MAVTDNQDKFLFYLLLSCKVIKHQEVVFFCNLQNLLRFVSRLAELVVRLSPKRTSIYRQFRSVIWVLVVQWLERLWGCGFD